MGIVVPNTPRVFVGESYIKEKPAETGNFKISDINPYDSFQVESELLNFYKTIEVDGSFDNKNTELMKQVEMTIDKKGKGMFNNKRNVVAHINPVTLKLVNSPHGWNSANNTKAQRKSKKSQNEGCKPGKAELDLCDKPGFTL